jgi:RNA polymerase sigma factor for flagellar operon FliA
MAERLDLKVGRRWKGGPMKRHNKLEVMPRKDPSSQSQKAPKSAFETVEAKRECLILEHMRQVHLIAGRFHRKIAGTVSLDDLVSAGTLGLIAAIDNFHESFGVKLCTYAEHKIRGAILDSLRSSDWASRGRRQKAKEMDAAVQNLELRLHRSPTVEEVAADRSMSIDEYHAHTSDSHALKLLSLEAPASNRRGLTLGALIPDDVENLPSAILERSERKCLLKRAVDAMPNINRTVLNLSYSNELTRREVAAAMGIDVSRVTRLKEDSMQRLRKQFGEQYRSHAPSRGHSTRLLWIA